MNEEESLAPLHSEIKSALPLDLSHEIIFIDDGSTDRSNRKIKEIISVDDKVSLITLSKNHGKSNALNIGFRHSKGDIVVTMDADLQDDPHEIENLIIKLNEGWDVVSGWKMKRNDPISKTFPSKIFNFVVRYFSGLDIHDFNCGLKAYRSKVIKSLNIYGGLHRFIPYLVVSEGFSVTEIAVNHRSREFGDSKYGGSRMFKGFFDFLSVLFVTRYSKRPLHVFGFVGFGLFVSGLVVNLFLSYQWILYRFYLDIPYSIDRPLLFLGILLIIIGIQIFSIGFIAELIVSYLSKDEKVDKEIITSED